MDNQPVSILGAGPAGLCAAIVLARAGRTVTVYERQPQVGRRFSGDLHGVENWSAPTDCVDELSGFGIELNFDFTPWHELHLSNGRRRQRLNFKKPLFYMVARGCDDGCLDAGLADQARELGVTILFNSTRDASQVDIVATVPDPSEIFVIEKGYLFETDAADLAAALIHPTAAPGGYAYLLVSNGKGVLCSVAFERFTDMSGALSKATEYFSDQFDVEINNPRPIGGIGSCCWNRFSNDNGTWRVGEAFGLQDQLFGFGIRNAMVSGAMAGLSWKLDQDYFHEAQLRFSPGMRCGAPARAMWTRWAHPLFSPLVWALKLSRDPHAVLARAHRPNRVYRLLG